MATKQETPHKVLASTARVKDSLAGCCAGVAQTLVGQPFDTIKVRLQTQVTKFVSQYDVDNIVIA